MTLPAPGLARLTQSFGMILFGLSDAAAARMSRPTTKQQQAAFPVLMLLWGRLRRTIARFAAIAANPIAANPIAAPSPSPSPCNPAQPRTRKPSEQQRLPSGFGWLVKVLPEAAVFGCQLQHFLTEPEMAALIAANPKIAALLRPLCRMLAVPGPPKPGLPKPGPPKPAPVAPTQAAAAVPTTRTRQASDPPGPSQEDPAAKSSDLVSPLAPTENCNFKRA